MKNNLVTMITKEGREIEVAPHMVDTYKKHGVTLTRKVIREVPKELLKMPDKTNPLPAMEITPGLQIVEPNQIITDPVKKERKKPVRSRAK